MRLIVNEFLKLLSKRIFTVCLVISLFANVAFLYYTQKNDYNCQLIMENKQLYQQLIEETSASDNAREYLSNKSIEMLITSALADVNDNGAKNSASYTRKIAMLEAYKQSNPEEYKKAMESGLTSEQSRNIGSLITLITPQLDYADSYKVFVDQMEQRANEQKSFAIFAQPGSFSYKNIEKTPQDFQQLKGLQLVVGNNTAVEIVTQLQLPDYLMLFIIVLMCIFLFCVEREKGLYPVLRSTKYGRVPTMLSKLTVLTVLTVVTAVVMYCLNIFICGFSMGLGDLQRPIQSIELFMNCSLKISVLQYLILWVAGKTVTFLAIALLFAFIFVIIKNSAKVYAIIIAFLGVELFCYLFIESNSVFSVFKYVNIMYLISGDNLYGTYLNINLFNTPVNVIILHIILTVLLIIVGIVGSCVSFAVSTQFAGKSVLAGKLSAFIAKHRKIKGSVKVYNGEAFKHYKTSFAAVVVALLVVFAYTTYTDDLKIVFQDAEKSAYNTYMETLQGDYTEQTKSFIKKEQAYFDDLNKQLEELAKNTEISEEERNSKTQGIMNILDSKGKAFDEILQQIDYTLEKSEEIGCKPALINEITCKRLTESYFREWQFFTIVLIATIFCTANIFACEHKNSMINLIRCTKNGKSRLACTKLFTVWLTASVSFVLVYLPYFINYIKTFGTDAFNLPLAYMQDFAGLSDGITVVQFILTEGVLHYIAVLVTVALVYMLSMLLKNNAMTMIVASGAVVIPCMVFMENDSVRLMSVFKNGIWLPFTVCAIAGAAALTALFLVITFKKFNNRGRRHYRGAHYKQSK